MSMDGQLTAGRAEAALQQLTKHEDLLKAIEDLGYLVCRIEGFRDRIRGAGDPKNVSVDKERQPISLADALNAAPDLIRHHIAVIDDMMTEMDKLLF